MIFIQQLTKEAQFSHSTRLIGILLVTEFMNGNQSNPKFGHAWPSQKTLADRLRITDRAVRKSVKHLVNSRWFFRSKEGHSHLYTPNLSGVVDQHEKGSFDD